MNKVSKPKVSKSLQRKWIHALESGKYAQGKNCLRSEDNKFCCLGVLCDIVSPNWVEAGSSFDHDAGSIGPSFEIRRKAGLVDGEDSVLITSPLMAMNDEHGDSFEDIALTLRMLFNIWD